MSAQWDKEQIYDEHIAPLMTQIIAICKEHAIPIVATFQYNAEGDRCTTVMGHEQASDDMRRVMGAVSPKRREPALAITEVSGPDGTRVTVRQV